MTTGLHTAVGEVVSPPATAHHHNFEAPHHTRLGNLGAEMIAALAGTAFSAVLLIIAAAHAGPLWRDETNTMNMALMPSLKALWSNMQFESFPPLWPLILRGLTFLGLTRSDAGIRTLGLCVGLLFLVSLWLCARWMGNRAPTLSVALLGALPAMVFVVGANRAYGLASCLLVFSFGMIWRMLQLPSAPRILGAGIVCLLFAHCLYYDVIFLCAMLFAGAVVAIRRREWRTVWSLSGIGGVAGASMAIYLPITLRTTNVLPMIRAPFFRASAVWYGLARAVADRSSSRPGTPGSQIWIWVFLVLAALVVALTMQRVNGRQTHDGHPVAASAGDARRDLALFCLISLSFGLAGFFFFLVKLRFFLQIWYYIGSLSLCAVSLDGILNAGWPSLAPWGLMRIGFMVVMMILTAGSAWQEAHTRRSNVDLAASVLQHDASPGDLIVLQDAWEGITFDRYYHGDARWVTIPPIDSHKVHRTDLVMAEISRGDPMAPVLDSITKTLESNHSVWVVGSMRLVRLKSPLRAPPPSELPTGWWLGTYLSLWNAEVSAQLFDHARLGQVVQLAETGPVSYFENVSLIRFSGYRSDVK